MYQLSYYFLLFIIYSVLGWLMEEIITSIVQKKITNRGFLIGPYCPIYGVAGITMTFLLSNLKENIPLLFIASFLVCSAIEYLTSFLMEKLFKARWWDYSHKKFNLHGRICLSNALFFGILGVILIRYINPFFMHALDEIPHNSLKWVSMSFGVIFLIDLLLSFSVMNKIKKTITTVMKEDSTSEISAKVNDLLKQKGTFFFKRLLKAYPSISFPKINRKEK